VARCLIIGCGCRGRLLAQALITEGHAVRGTTRQAPGCAAIEATGAEAVVADPDRVGTLVPALEHVTVVCILLGSAQAPAGQLEALHGTRLEMLLTRLVDTTVHGIVYETCGSVDPLLLERGAELVQAFAARVPTRWAPLDVDPGEPQRWLAAATQRVAEVLGPR